VNTVLARILVATLLEEVVSNSDVAAQYSAWILQRGGAGFDQSSFNAWLRYHYPDRMADAGEIFDLASRSSRRSAA
jgi:hypothetical protein